jgi:hypothetical protein
MLSMLQAHGLDAGPTQRPVLTGSVAGLVSAVPAIGVMLLFGSLEAPSRASGASPLVVAAAAAGLLLLGGVLYGWLFQRAANDTRGGWLFGLAFGFVLWMVGPVPLLQWLPAEPILRGYPAAGLLLGQLVWGLSLGMAFPSVGHWVQARAGGRSAGAAKVGPAAAVASGLLRSHTPVRSRRS